MIPDGTSLEQALQKANVKAALTKLATRAAYNKSGCWAASASATRRSARSHKRPDRVDPLHHVLSQDNAESMHSTTQALLLCTSSTAAPIMALCSGHLLDDHLDDHGGTQDGICGRCGRPAVEIHATGLGSVAANMAHADLVRMQY